MIPIRLPPRFLSALKSLNADPKTGGKAGQGEGVSIDGSALQVKLLPNFVLRRLWAPNDGVFKMPPPPKLISEW
ncbi:hypothetical protein Ciccas_004785 [Cichlidogyrus casuarinus]|uniref:Uncharacterized protein n=1 Tax=Cichlidogyrus casuarinus TaxID=1844966 RepID=A0ABD2QE06_9PLAT